MKTPALTKVRDYFHEIRLRIPKLLYLYFLCRKNLKSKQKYMSNLIFFKQEDILFSYINYCN
jgi:hypothetical protein